MLRALSSTAPASLLANMADNREAIWTDDDKLKEALTRYVQQGLQRSEALDFLRREFPEYAWSIRSLDRRLRHFNIFYNDRSVKVDDVKEAVEEELKGPGKLLGYRALHKKIRLEHGLNVHQLKCRKPYLYRFGQQSTSGKLLLCCRKLFHRIRMAQILLAQSWCTFAVFQLLQNSSSAQLFHLSPL
jgi:hypothetical protein